MSPLTQDEARAVAIRAEPLSVAVCRFTVDRPVFEGGAAYFPSKGSGKLSPLAARLFSHFGVGSVLISHNVVTITKNEGVDWRDLGKQVGQTIREFLVSGDPAVTEEWRQSLPSAQELRTRVQEVLDREVNPMVASHGGSVELIDVRENNLYIRMGGGCQGCGMAAATLKQGVESSIREKVPQVGDILDVTDHGAGRNPYFKEGQ